MNKAIQVNLDLNNLDPLALEITKAYLNTLSQQKELSPKMFTGSFIGFYALVLTELEKIKQDKNLLNKLLENVLNLDFSELDNYED